MAQTTHHVAPAVGGGWSVRKAGAARASRHFSTKDEAEAWARKTSRATGSKLVIHKRDGTVQRKDSHGKDSTP